MSDEAPKREPFHWKGLTSFTIAWTFLIMAVSGCVLYASPRGRVANWTGWAVTGLDKEAWAVLHIGAAAVFIIATAFHLYFNWTVFTCYFKMRFQKGFHLKREFALATLIALLVVLGSVFYLPPFSWLADANEAIKDHWEGWRAPAPYPHAEESTIADFAARTGRDAAAVRQALVDAGYAVGDDPDATLAEVAAANGVTPSALFRAIDPGAGRGGGRGGGHGGGGAGSGRGAAQTWHDDAAPSGHAGEDHVPGAGPGYGRMTVEQAAAGAGVGADAALEALRSAGIDATANDTLRDLATEAGMRPSDIHAIIAGQN